MANIRKSFNFSSGVQVDNDNFVVSPVGLVGIGTSVPTAGYKLDVRGSIKSTGLTTTQDLNVSRNVEVSGITTVGFITASSMGITTDLTVGGKITANTLELENGLALDNIIGYAFTTFISDNAGIGLHTSSKIGLNTTTSPGASDNALEVFGDVNVTGVITASTFYGALSGPVTGNVNASSGVSTFTELKVGTAITMSAGIVTATTFSGSGASLTNIPNEALTNSSVSFGGVSTSLGSSVAQPAFDLTNATSYLYNNLSGISTEIVGDTSPQLGGNLDLNSNNITGTGNVNITGIITATTFDGNVTGTATTATNLSNGANITEGTISNDRLPTTPKFTGVGIGTSTPANTFQQRETGATELQITSDTSSASITVGREPGTSNTNNAEFRYGGNGGFALSNAQSLDIVNYGTGNFNYYLSANNAGAAAGDYIWHKGANNDQLMALTRDGNLGLGITNPSHKLNVQGISTFIGNAHFDSNLTIGGDLTITSGSFSEDITGDITGDIYASDGVNKILESGTDGTDALLTGNVNAASGISTFNHVTIDRIGIGTTAVSNNASLFVDGSVRARRGISIGTTDNPKCSVDMSTIVGIDTTFAYMIPPKITTTQRDGLTNQHSESLGADEAGAMIYNTLTNKLQVWNGSTWNDCF